MKSKKAPTNIDDYIATFPPNVQKILQKIRITILNAAPDAKETISYQMPAFIFKGNLVYFAAYKNHIGLYPAPMGIEKFQNEIAKYRTGKGTLQFQLDEPIPYGLISKIVKFRVKANLEKEKTKKKK